MARAVVARRLGDDFQARFFWLTATALLDSRTSVIRVGYETGPKGFDDITVEHNPDYAPQDHAGKPIYRKHLQCKWHTIAGVFGYEDLTDPAFIHAQRISFLQRALDAQRQYAPESIGCQFKLVTNWRIKEHDPLLELVRKESGALDLDRLFDGTTDRSRMGQVRKRWREHLGVDDAQLLRVARTLVIAECPDSLADLRERLDDRLSAVGMRREPVHRSAFIYDDLTYKLLTQAQGEFDRESFREMCRREGLLESSPQPRQPLMIGVRSFMHPIDDLQERCERMLNLVPYFDGRYIRNNADWHHKVLPELDTFLLQAARAASHLRLALDAHVSLAFAVGAILNVKSGKRIEIEQRTDGRRFWAKDDKLSSAQSPALVFEEERVAANAPEIAVAIGLTHDIASAVRGFLATQLPSVGCILHAQPAAGPSQRAVENGRHASGLAESIVQQVRKHCAPGAPRTKLHIFIAGPNGFAFFLGQHQQALGPTALYEWDFEGLRDASYRCSLSLGD